MKFLFIVQGEGRGHMTQALAMSQILREGGHEVCRVIVGKSHRRGLPAFFTGKIGAPIAHLDSPNFVTDKDQKSVSLRKTILSAVWKSPRYLRSMHHIHRLVKDSRPDVILNFYDFLGGLYYFTFRPKARMICLAHQYLLGHPEFTFPERRNLEKRSLLLGNRLTSLGAERVLALSFQSFADEPGKRLFVVPPLLRNEVKERRGTVGKHLLVYMVNPGYAPEVEAFHQRQPSIPLHCFWDKKDAPKTLEADATLTFHQLDDQLFIDKMASSRGYVTTAGFESVCEAMYLGKPVLMVPVAGHYEQACNAIDAQKAGAGIASDQFEIEKLVQWLPEYKDTSVWFRDWVSSAPGVFLSHLEDHFR